jgi:hypothetical protein
MTNANVVDERGYYLSRAERYCAEHRTVGSHRAWCHDCSEWCYPANGAEDVLESMACTGCTTPVMEAEVRRLRALLGITT